MARAEPPADVDVLASRWTLNLGGAQIKAAERQIVGAFGVAIVEPRVMQVLVVLAANPGDLVPRQLLLERCWAGAAVGDDSLNRAISRLRAALKDATGDALRVETVAGAGYILELAPFKAGDGRAAALEAGWNSWRLGAPRVDVQALSVLRRFATTHPQDAEIRAMLALTLRQAAEYAELDHCSAFVAECEVEAAAALAIDPANPHAQIALIGLLPIFGDWLPRRRKLLALLDRHPGEIAGLHELAILEMATGRPSAALALNDEMFDREPLAATLHYKRTYLLWTAGRLAEMDQIAHRGMQLWPGHAAIWFARLWTLAFTGRAQQAQQQLGEERARPPLPAPASALLNVTLAALADPDDHRLHRSAVEANLDSARLGPAQSVAATIHLAGLGEAEAALGVAEGYLLRRGDNPAGIYRTASDPSVTDQHRRLTQMLFVPVSASLRQSPRFLSICRDIQLARYWDEARLKPDFLAAATGGVAG